MESKNSENEAKRYSTEGSEYTRRLVSLNQVWWKRLLNVQAPYRWNLKKQNLGRCLDIGCGIGRNLINLQPGSVGVDHNPDSVAVARSRKLLAFTPQEFAVSGLDRESSFDSLLVSHVLEHMTFEQGAALLLENLKYLRPGGRVMIICPQEAGYRSDATHVEYMSQDSLKKQASLAGLKIISLYSFPFPSVVGNFFKYNEHVLIASKPELQ